MEDREAQQDGYLCVTLSAVMKVSWELRKAVQPVMGIKNNRPCRSAPQVMKTRDESDPGDQEARSPANW